MTPLTLFDRAGGIQFALFDALHGCVQCSGQELCSLHVQHQLLSMTATHIPFLNLGVALSLKIIPPFS